jgi:hypothetical protein
MRESELVNRVAELLDGEEVVAAGIFNPRGHSGAFFAGSFAGDSVGAPFGNLAGNISSAGGAIAGQRMHDAASGLPEWLVLGVTPTAVIGFDTDSRRRPTRPLFRLERANVDVKVHQRVNVRVLELIDRSSGDSVELEGNRIPLVHTGAVLDALSG